MANKKAYYYFEFSIPASVREAHEGNESLGIMKALLEAHIAETDSKHSKIVRDYVFGDVKHHSTESNDAVSIEFINARHYEQYITVVEEFRTWATANHNVTFSNELHNKYPLDIENEEIENQEDVFLPYGVEMKDYFFVKHPTARGF